jgi:hypothetical protein
LAPAGVLAFDMENLKVKDDGTILYAMGVELTQKVKGGKAKPILKRAPQSMEAVNTLAEDRDHSAWRLSAGRRP